MCDDRTKFSGSEMFSLMPVYWVIQCQNRVATDIQKKSQPKLSNLDMVFQPFSPNFPINGDLFPTFPASNYLTFYHMCFTSEGIPHSWWRKFWIKKLWNASEWSIFTRFLVNSFTMVEDNSEFQSFEILQNKAFSLGFLVNSFTMVEEHFEFQSFQMLQNEVFSLGFHPE